MLSNKLKETDKMFIKEITNTIGNDFYCTYECEHCGNLENKGQGYNDGHYHCKVIPAKYCESCGLNRAGETKDKSGVNENCVPA